MKVIENAFESSDIILFDHKKFSNVRTHPEELRDVKNTAISSPERIAF